MNSATRNHRYHHGNLRTALVEAGTALAREGGPSAMVLREAARRVGVSPNAAYRHFTALPDLIEAVAAEARTALARSMQDEIAHSLPAADPGQAAIELLGAVGRGYVQFALREPGLFAVAFSAKMAAPPLPCGPSEASRTSPGELLEGALDAMIAAGILAVDKRDAAAVTAWAAVHGLAQLLLGPLAGMPATDRDELINSCLDLVGVGLISR